MNINKFKVYITYVWLIMTSNYALAAILNCPASIQTTQSLVKNVDGWQSFLDDWNNIYHFNRVTFYSGHPKSHASLAPDNEHPKSNRLIWTFNKEQIWLACGYSNTNVQLIQELPKSVRTCTVTHELNFSKVTEIRCN